MKFTSINEVLASSLTPDEKLDAIAELNKKLTTTTTTTEKEVTLDGLDFWQIFRKFHNNSYIGSDKGKMGFKFRFSPDENCNIIDLSGYKYETEQTEQELSETPEQAETQETEQAETQETEQPEQPEQETETEQTETVYIYTVKGVTFWIKSADCSRDLFLLLVKVCRKFSAVWEQDTKEVADKPVLFAYLPALLLVWRTVSSGKDTVTKAKELITEPDPDQKELETTAAAFPGIREKIRDYILTNSSLTLSVVQKSVIPVLDLPKLKSDEKKNISALIAAIYKSINRN